MPKRVFDIFVSHVSGDAELAGALKDCIEEDFTSLEVFVSSDSRSIDAGEWLKQIKSGLAESKVVIVLCSPESVRRPWIAFEAGAAWLNKGTRLGLLCHSGMHQELLPNPFNSLQAVRIDTKGLGWIYQQIKDKFPKVKRMPSDDRVNSAVRKLDVAVQSIIVRRQLRDQVSSVMALCFRDTDQGREYLLVRTSSGGKWTFPKGSIKTGSDMSDYIELLRQELREEAGASGELFESHFGPFPYLKESGEARQVLAFPVRAALVSAPQEAARSPSWFALDEAQRRLVEGRRPDVARGLLQALEFVSRFKGRP